MSLGISPDGQWHTDTMEAMTRKTPEQLKFIQRDAAEAAKAAEGLGNEIHAGMYWDEHHYAAMELTKRIEL